MHNRLQILYGKKIFTQDFTQCLFSWLFTEALTATNRQNDRELMNEELGMMWKEVVVVYLRLCVRNNKQDN